MGRTLRSFSLVPCAVLVVTAAAADEAAEVRAEPPPEAIFTERAFAERTAEFDVDGDFDEGGGGEVDLSLIGTWTYARRLQLGLEVPYSIVAAKDEPDESGFSDLGISTQLVLCCPDAEGIAFVSARFEVEAPTGDLSKGIGGNGSLAFSLLGDYGVEVVPEWGDLSLQVELTYEQEIKKSDVDAGDEDQTGPRSVREKEILWNVALVQPVLGRRLVPALELLGTTTLDAADPAEEGTSAQVGVGLWSAPFDAGALRALRVGAGYRFPITGRRSDDGGVLGIVKWTFD